MLDLDPQFECANGTDSKEDKAPKNETSDHWALATITDITERRFEKGNARILRNFPIM